MKTSSIVTSHLNTGSYSCKLLQCIKVLYHCYMKTDWSAQIHVKQKDMTIKLTYQYFPLCMFDFIYLPYNYLCKFTFFYKYYVQQHSSSSANHVKVKGQLANRRESVISADSSQRGVQ